jgi:molybdopterin synthase catalytic subunit
MSGRKTGTNWIGLLSEALPTAEAVDFVHDPAAGGIDVFLGTTRAESKGDAGAELLALDYEAYPEMALQQMNALAGRARERWPVVKLVLLHRTGRVPLGQPSVLIAVSTPHRAASFEACRFLIDELKSDVAIWKKEVWADGAATWVHPDNR